MEHVREVVLDRSLAARAEHREAVVLACDLDLPGGQILDRVVGPAVAEAQLVGLEADRAAEELVTEADAEDRQAADEAAHLRDQVVERRRVPRAVDEHQPVGRVLEDLRCGGGAGVDPKVRSARAQARRDRALDAGVDHGDRGPAAPTTGRLELERLRR